MLETIKNMLGIKKEPLKDTWLIQRLHTTDVSPKEEGAEEELKKGLFVKDEKLTSKAMSIFRPLWRFDYMGSAEFEFGSIPKALRMLVQKNFGIWETTIQTSVIPKPFMYERAKAKRTPPETFTFQVIGDPNYQEEINQIILDVAQDGKRLKERLGLAETTWVEPGTWPETRGWFEIDNNFFFFLDLNVAEELFRILYTAKHGVKSKKQLSKIMAASRKR